MSSENSEVVKTVIESGGKILLARPTEAGCWEFPTAETEENLKDKAIQITEEVTGSDEIEAENLRPGDSYREEKSRVTPVYVELNEERKGLIKEKTLSDSYTEVKWIDVKEFDEFNTGEEYRALEHLNIVNGRVALAFVERNGKFLAVKRSEENSTPGKWSTVSGGIEVGETPEEAAVRELSEETGLEAEVERTGEYYIGRGENGVWRLEPVLMSYTSGEIDLNWELSEHRWVKPEEVENLDTIGKLKGFDKLGLR